MKKAKKSFWYFLYCGGKAIADASSPDRLLDLQQELGGSIVSVAFKNN